jgi:hypothetical protein
MEPLAPEAVTEPVTEKKSRWKLGGTASTALLLSFFFAVGLAGGVLYRLLPTTTNEKVAVHDSVPPAAPAPPVIAQNTAPSSGAATLPAKPASPANAPAQSAAAHPAPNATASAPLPAIPPSSATTPPPIAPIAGTVTPEAAQFAPASDQAAATPPPDKSASPTPGKGKAAAAATAKPKLALAKQKAAPVKRPAIASAASPSHAVAGPVRIQFGAFAIEDNAHRVQWTVEATGIPVEVTQLPSPKGRLLYYVRSQPFPDHAAALSAATTAQDKAKTLVNPVALQYIILPDTPTPAQQAQVAGH